MSRISPLLVLALLLATIAAVGCGEDAVKKATESAKKEAAAQPLLFERSQLKKAVDALKQRTSPKAELLEVSIKEYEIKFQVYKGPRAADGFIWERNSTMLNPFKVKVYGSGSLDPGKYPLSKLDLKAPSKIVSGLKDDDPKIENIFMRFVKELETAKLIWKIDASSGSTYSIAYEANADGSGLEKTDEGTSTESSATSTSGTESGTDTGSSSGQAPVDPDQALEQAQCLQEARGDVEKVQECTK